MISSCDDIPLVLSARYLMPRLHVGSLRLRGAVFHGIAEDSSWQHEE